MSGPGPREPPQAGGPAGPESADAAPGEAGLSFAPTDLSLVEMTEVEYTQLQHILCSHMDAADGELDARLGSAFLAAAPSATAPGGFAAGGAAAGGAAPVYPVLCPPALADGGFAGAAPCLGHVDFQELRMMLLSEAGAPPAAEKTPGANGPGAARPKADGKENAGAEGAPEARAKSAVRVRLEDRFSSAPAEPPPAPRSAEPPESSVALNKWVPGRRRAGRRRGVDQAPASLSLLVGRSVAGPPRAGRRRPQQGAGRAGSGCRRRGSLYKATGLLVGILTGSRPQWAWGLT